MYEHKKGVLLVCMWGLTCARWRNGKNTRLRPSLRPPVADHAATIAPKTLQRPCGRLTRKPAPYTWGENERENWSLVFLAHLGTIDVNSGIECREAIDKNEPARIQGMAEVEKVRAATLYMLVQVLQPPTPRCVGSWTTS